MVRFRRVQLFYYYLRSLELIKDLPRTAELNLIRMCSLFSRIPFALYPVKKHSQLDRPSLIESHGIWTNIGPVGRCLAKQQGLENEKCGRRVDGAKGRPFT